VSNSCGNWSLIWRPPIRPPGMWAILYVTNDKGCRSVPSAPYGLAIELKKVKGGRVSQSQNEWLKSLEMRGFKAIVAKGFDEAVKVLELYLHCHFVSFTQTELS
jgi:hypothetical protein